MTGPYAKLEGEYLPDTGRHQDVDKHVQLVWNFVDVIREGDEKAYPYTRGLIELRGYNFWRIDIAMLKRLPAMKILFRFKRWPINIKD